MRAMKWTSLTLMLMLAFSSVAQEEFFDDIYYSTKEKKEASKVETNVVKAKKVETVKADNSEPIEAMSADERDVDEYNRRYSSDDVYAEEMQDEAAQEETVAVDPQEEKERRSDLEYTERIVRFHSPSKLTIAGADQVDLYLSEGY